MARSANPAIAPAYDTRATKRPDYSPDRGAAARDRITDDIAETRFACKESGAAPPACRLVGTLDPLEDCDGLRLRGPGMRATLAALAACFALASAACAGGGDDDRTAEFVAQVNAICADYRPKLALIPPPAEDPDEWVAIGADMADLLEASVNELRLLEPPGSLDDEYGDWLALRSDMTTAMRDVQTAGGSHDAAGIAAGLQRMETLMAEADPLAEELGFAECSPTGVTTAR